MSESSRARDVANQELRGRMREMFNGRELPPTLIESILSDFEKEVKRETVEACIKAVEETRPFTQSSLCMDLERKEIFRALEKLLEEP